MLQKLMVPFISNQACLLLLQGDAIAFVLGWSKGMKKAQLLKLINEKMKQGSARGQGAQVRPILIPSDPHHSLRPKPVCLRFKNLLHALKGMSLSFAGPSHFSERAGRLQVWQAPHDVRQM